MHTCGVGIDNLTTREQSQPKSMRYSPDASNDSVAVQRLSVSPGNSPHEMRNELSSRRLRCETKICRQGGHNAEDRESIRGWTVWTAVTG